MAYLLGKPDISRNAALKHLTDITPKLGYSYAKERNFDRGPGCHDSVTTLSPWIRHRLLLEEEAVSAALNAHGSQAAEKFVQEVFWRTYWKGWLELRPSVWQDYVVARDHDLNDWNGDAGLARALSGQTGISCFDHWVAELKETHYLHNHARMWFASIWVFTLGLPWTLGADFFLQQLLDGDPASNTLSWRWVSGLQTPGKTYLARAENIQTFTEGRFYPDSQLATEAPTLDWSPAPMPSALTFPAPLQSGIPSILLLHDDDLCPETAPLPLDDIVGVALLNAADLRSTGQVAHDVSEFVAVGLRDAVQRLSNGPDMLTCDANPKTIAALAGRLGAQRIVYAHAPVGPVRDAIDDITGQLSKIDEARRLIMEVAIRKWDAGSWPYAAKGFFNFKKYIPSMIASLQQ